MKKFHMMINVERCEDCNACLLSCKDEHDDNTFPGYTVPQPRHGQKWISITRKERGAGSLMDVFYLPKPCQHCDDAPCVKKSGGAITKRADGIVLIDPVKAKGNKQLVKTCPYGVISWNEELKVAQKCTMCAHLLDNKWKEPRCVQVCPTEALKFVHLEDEEWDALVRREKLEPLHPEFGTRPGAAYRNLEFFTKAFIAGSVAAEKNGIQDCVEGARVVLRKNSKTLAELTTDNYGDFKFDHLPENSGEYKVTIESAASGSANLTVNLQESVYLGSVIVC
jgi:Fe-S-cluster-containing dehydrogenase component